MRVIRISLLPRVESGSSFTVAPFLDVEGLGFLGAGLKAPSESTSEGSLKSEISDCSSLSVSQGFFLGLSLLLRFLFIRSAREAGSPFASFFSFLTLGAFGSAGSFFIFGLGSRFTFTVSTGTLNCTSSPEKNE